MRIFTDLLAKRIALLLIMLAPAVAIAADESPEPPPIGNFSMPWSQQPGPLFGFGQLVLGQGVKQLSLSGDDYTGRGEYFVDVLPLMTLGITDNLSLSFFLPIAARFKIDTSRSSGLEDASIQAEYAFYNNSTTRYVDCATVIGGITLPTGSITKDPTTGMGAPSLFLGGTFGRMFEDWFVFAAPGVTLTTSANGTQFGNIYYYQGGLGRDILVKNGWLFAWMVEADGTYTQRNKLDGSVDPDSGGNIIYVTPSLWLSTKQFIFQAGIGYPATQHWNGDQHNDTALLIASMSWTID